MNQKTLFVDLDGTLLCDDKSVSKKNREVIQKMLEAGHYLVLATGRTIDSGRIVARELGLTRPGCYMLAFNGALIYDCAADRVLLNRSLPIDVVQELFDKAKKAGLYVQTYNKMDIVAERHTKELDFYRKKTRLSYKLSENVLDVLEEEPQKVILISLDDKKRLEKFQKENKKWEQGKCSSFFSCQEFLEYCPSDVSKGYGLCSLIKILDLPTDSTIAVGDEENDIAMIQAAHIGVAMKNGIAQIKEAADYVTENDNNHDAIAEVIEKFILV